MRSASTGCSSTAPRWAACSTIAFAALHPDRMIAGCADVAFAKPDVYRKTLFRVWRRMAESMPWDEFSDHVTTQAVGAKFMESPEGENVFEMVREIVNYNDPYTVRQACLAMEAMDLSPLVPNISRPLLMTNGTLRHPLPARARPLRPRRAEDGRDERQHHASSSSPTSAMPTCSSARRTRSASSPSSSSSTSSRPATGSSCCRFESPRARAGARAVRVTRAPWST